jgi:hypothetical protein
MNQAESLRQKLIEIDVMIEELTLQKNQLEDQYYSLEEEATYE